MLYGVVCFGIMFMEGVVAMKLYYDKKSWNPTYFIQQGIRNGKKTTTKNVKRIGRHSELLAVTSDPLAYAKKQVEEFNREYKEGKIDLSIEDCFRVLKTNFEARPVFHRNRKRIIAHFIICYTALLIYRLLENKLDEYGTHFTTDNILDTLRNMNVVNIKDSIYAATYTASQVCTSLNGLFDLALDKKYYQPKELNKKLKKISG